MTSNKYPFVDAVFAAELLGVQTADVLEWIASGRLSSFGGKDRNPFVRTGEVEALARELGRDLTPPPAKRRATQNPVRRVELRIRHDTRWSDVSEEDIRAWARELDGPTRIASQKVAATAVDRLRRILDVLNEDAGSD